MHRTTFPITCKQYGLQRGSSVWRAARSICVRHGLAPAACNDTLLMKIQQAVKGSPFKGEGHKKHHAQLKRDRVVAGRNRVLRVMREHNLLSPSRHSYHAPKKRDGKITTEDPYVGLR